MAKHTPGPWLFNPDDVEVIYQDEDGYSQITLMACTFPPTKEDLANGYLIAASPELLEMARDHKKNLEWLAKKDRREGDEEGYRLKMLSVMRVDDLIKRATGEAEQEQPCP